LVYKALKKDPSCGSFSNIEPPTTNLFTMSVTFLTAASFLGKEAPFSIKAFFFFDVDGTVKFYKPIITPILRFNWDAGRLN